MKKAEDELLANTDAIVGFTPLHTSKQKPGFSAIKKQILQRFRQEEYEQLAQDLFSYGLSRSYIESFFLEEGHPILSWALIGVSTIDPLLFLYKNVPKEILQELLSYKNFSILETFLFGQSGIEDLGWYDATRQKYQIEKFKILLAIDETQVQKFMVDNSYKSFVTQNIQSNYSTALNQYRDTQYDEKCRY